MADVFVSYSREDSELAVSIVDALNKAGLSVWIDRHIPTASRWEREIARELEQARCVVMLWSRYAQTSEWVRKEGLSGLERAVLVPTRMGDCDIPNEFGEFQFADLTAWNGSSSAPEFQDLLQCVRSQMSPRCQIAFDSAIAVRMDDVANLYDAYLHMAKRLDRLKAPDTFSPPRSSDERRALWRAVAPLQVVVEWHPALQSGFESSTRRENLLDIRRRIERHIPLLWLRMLSYCGPFYLGNVSGPRTHAKFIEFASLSLFHSMVWEARAEGWQTKLPLPLTEATLAHPRWEECLNVMLDNPDEVARGYVTHIDDCPLPREEVFYGPKYRLRRAYGRSLRNVPFTDPLWLEQYLIPQRELRLAQEGASEQTEYGGNARLRKITDLNGADIEPLYNS